MTAHLTEEEQLETLKHWWADNGNNLLSAVGLAVAGYFGWQAWQSSQREAAEAASALYSDMFAATQVEAGQSLTEEKITTIKHFAKQLKEQHAGSTYAHNAAMLLAKLAVEDGNLEEAESELTWVTNAGAEDGITDVANLRLARVLFAEGKLSEALALTQVSKESAFEPLLAELRGDIYAAQNNLELARAAYASALAGLDAGARVKRNIIQLKLDNLKVAEPAAVTTEEDAA